jgi:hypothetical protein
MSQGQPVSKAGGKDVDGDGIDDVDENGCPLDARQQHLQRLVMNKDPTGGDAPWAKKAMERAYDR